MLRQLADRFADFAGRFYDWGAVGADKLSNGLKFPRLASSLNRRWSKRPAILGVELLVALSLAVTCCLAWKENRDARESLFGPWPLAESVWPSRA